MASGPDKDEAPANNVDAAKMRRVLIPALAVGSIVVLVAVIAGISDSGKKMSDGSNGTMDDPDLKELALGVQYRDVKEGSGDPCLRGVTVRVNKLAWTPDGTEVEASKDEEVNLNDYSVPNGLQNGIPGMKVGGIRKLVLSPDKAYGPRIKGKVPANSTLIYEIELLSTAPGPLPERPRRSPAPTDLSKLADGSSPSGEDENLKPIGDKGLKYRDIKEGDGPVVQRGATVLVDYIGWLHSDGHRFDSSWTNKEPFSTSLAKVIQGWQQGIPGMKVGGIRKLVIPSDLAYGESGAGKDIPPNATLVFEIELLQTK